MDKTKNDNYEAIFNRKKISKTKGEVEHTRKPLVFKIAITLFIIAGILVLLYMTFYLQAKAANYKKKYQIIQEQCQELEVENAELQSTLDSDDMSKYLEKLAIEKYGYAYPDEIRFFDKSHN